MKVGLQTGFGALVRGEKCTHKAHKTFFFWFIRCLQKRLSCKVRHVLFLKTHLQHRGSDKSAAFFFSQLHSVWEAEVTITALLKH